MKKFSVLFSCILLVSLSASYAGRVDIKDARQAGKSFYFERINQYSNTPFESIFVSGERLVQVNGEPAYYVFNFNIDKGFVLVSADDASWPVIGYSFKGNFSADEMPAHVAYWINHYSDQIVAAREQNIAADESTVNEWARLLNSSPSQLYDLRGITDVAPLITNDWNQDFPFNSKCPEDDCGGSFNGHVPVGCVATSMTQIMYYWRYPATGQGYHCIFPTPSYGQQCADFTNTTYEWNYMDNMGKNNNTFRENDPVAILSWHGGISVDMDYACPGSGSYTNKAATALKSYFKYASATSYVQKINYSTSDWANLMKTNLDASRPMEYAGQGPDGGHAWVCDGYQGTDYFHMNFGWGGAYNGYYYLNNINPGGSTFNSQQGAIINIEPNPSYYPVHCTGQTVLDAYSWGSMEDGSGPVADYPNNANCSWLISPDDSVEKVTLNFFRFDLDAGDFVTVYDGSTTSAPMLGQFTGSTIPTAVVSTGPMMLVTFTTNGSGTANGFQADYESTWIPFCESSTTLTDATGAIADGSGDFSYRNSTSCKWFLKPTNAVSLTLSFDNFNTESDKDRLQIYDIGSSALIETISGEYTSPPGPFTAPSGQMLIIFTSNNLNRGSGWSATYSSTVATPEIEGVESLKVYPNPAGDFINVSFTATERQSVQIELVSLTGKVLVTENLGVVQGGFDRKYDIRNLSSGIYMMKITGDRGISTSKVVKQ